MASSDSLDPMDIAARIRPSMTKLYVTYFRIADQSDLTGPQLSIMTRLKDNGASRISQVAHDEGIRMPTASNALHQLEQRGLVRRIREETDRRGVRVELTAVGERELERVGEERTRYLADMLATLDDEHLAKAADLVDVINALANSYSTEQISNKSE
ncbi:MarR family winged helix-turn-helix transcriptional regulator [Corynebacterium cystitidis]|uniref:DNA-binding transcriptional regulator, MarR family n=1 Tax=Corynebacterium cystitidis DSM 20524 TaxID=1121357 RepID=A0A1H9UY51_9CORY|nr:MarR family transcriptional regulator [Corynebacterium cystitidis]WJY83637.1 putative HTH-type transcriptional regulator YusO [Corynebacterium cystitidis DSM 20524]SES14470.1 DNA-binding transcriptional regulator, MarR family [Corynebacterium cystitidis DSM 20524]SNV91604.1 Multiple antibiotic resistance protein marR [Corynebacterium cystitidis]